MYIVRHHAKAALTKDDISNIGYGLEHGYSSITEADESREHKRNTMEHEELRKWMKQPDENKKAYKGKRSCAAPRACFEHKVDIMYSMNYLWV